MSRMKIVRRILTFLGGQGCVQALSAVIGLVMLRILARDEFAIFSLVFGVQVTIGTLSDLGFNGAVLALAGVRHEDKNLLGSYVKSASVIRTYLVTLISIVVLGGIVLLHKIPHLPTSELISLILAVLVTLQFQAWASYYDAPLLLRNKLTLYYSPQIAGQVVRFAGMIVLYKMHGLTAAAVIWLNTANVVIMGVSYRLITREWLEIPRRASRERTREMLRYLAPLLPGIAYQAFSGQITLFLAALFGNITQLADVAAAGRVGQIFMLLSVSNSVLIGPMFARTHSHMLRQRYFAVLLAVIVVGVGLFLSARFYPVIYLLILGSRYAGLTRDVQLVVYASAISYVGGAMWSIAASRKWIFWWSGGLQLILLTGIQVISAFRLPLNTSEGILRMGLYVAWGSFAIQCLHAFQGLAMRHGEPVAAEGQLKRPQ